jgi:hypothetical protein
MPGVGDVGEGLEPVAGQGRLDRDEAADFIGVRGGEAEPRAAADVLAGEVDRAGAEVPHQVVHVLGGGGVVVAAVGGAGVTEPAQVHGEDPVRLRQQRDQLAEGPPGLRPPVGEQDRGAAGAGAHVVEPGSVDVGQVVGDAWDGRAGWRDGGHERLLQ